MLKFEGLGVCLGSLDSTNISVSATVFRLFSCLHDCHFIHFILLCDYVRLPRFFQVTFFSASTVHQPHHYLSLKCVLLLFFPTASLPLLLQIFIFFISPVIFIISPELIFRDYYLFLLSFQASHRAR